jgi:hypothetical protein
MNTIMEEREIQYVANGTTGQYDAPRLFMEYDCYGKRWRIWDFYATYFTFSPPYGSIWQGPANSVSNAISWMTPTWRNEGETGVVYDGGSKAYYSNPPFLTADVGQAGPKMYCEIQKTCSFTPQFPGALTGGTTYTWTDSLVASNITGDNRLTAYGQFLRSTNYSFQAVKPFTLPTSNGTANLSVYNQANSTFQWIDSTGNTVTETGLTVNYNWSITPVNSTVSHYTSNGILANGPANSPGITFYQDGDFVVPLANQTTSTNLTLTFSSVPNVTTSGTACLTTRNVTRAFPVHKVIKATFISNSVVGALPSGLPNVPVAVQNANGTYFYIYRTGQTTSAASNMTLGGYYWPVPSQYQSVNSSKQSHARRLFTVTSSSVSANTTANGVAYQVSFSHNFASTIEIQGSGTTLYQFTSNLSSTLPYTQGAKANITLTTSYPGGGTYQTLDLGTLELEVLEV